MELLVYLFQGYNYFEVVDVEIFIFLYGLDYKLKMVILNGEEIVVFNVDGEDLFCFL